MKKKTISVTVTYLTFWSQKRQFRVTLWTVFLGRVDHSPGKCASVTWRAVSIPGSFVGKQGDLRGEREISKQRTPIFFAQFTPCLFYFVLFSPVSFFFFFSKDEKLSQERYITCFLSDDGYQTIL